MASQRTNITEPNEDCNLQSIFCKKEKKNGFTIHLGKGILNLNLSIGFEVLTAVTIKSIYLLGYNDAQSGES
jgi:hypothetical protein